MPGGPLPWWAVAVPTGKFNYNIIVVQGSAADIHTKYLSDIIHGPYPTQAAAQQEADKLKGELGQPGPPPIPNPLSFLAWFQEVGHYIGLFVAYVTDGAMWRSIGWIALGFIFLLSGIILWAMKAAGVGSVAELGSVIAG